MVSTKQPNPCNCEYVLASCLGRPLVEVSCLYRSHNRRHLVRTDVYDRCHSGIGWDTRSLGLAVPVLPAADPLTRLISLADLVLELLEGHRTGQAGS